ncbi:MAG: TlpA family protein disulfide reductase [Bacteroides sp.]|nr:TlpA family protein disulfide reductase [Bacteroides sp.]
MKLEIDGNKPYAYVLSGTETEIENNELRIKLWKTDSIRYKTLNRITSLIEQINTCKDDIQIKSLSDYVNQSIEEFENICKQTDSLRLEFIIDHPDYQITPNLLHLLTERGYFDTSELAILFMSLPQKIQSSTMGRLANKQIKRKSQAMIGTPAPDFDIDDPEKKRGKLSDYKNRNYVLLDFWASWCGPCLKEIPKLKELYNQHTIKGLTIIGISLDEDKESWQNAINNHGLDIWPQVLNTAPSGELFNEKDLSETYNLDTGIPFYVLIDKQGKVIARWEWIGEEQINELKAILN